MKLCSDILFQALSKHVTVKSSGKPCESLSLIAPVFYDGHSAYQSNMVYIGRTGELPQPTGNVTCLIIAVGGDLPASWNPGKCCLFTIFGEMDILSVFNILQKTFSEYTAWSEELWRLLDSKADYATMIDKTATLMGRWIVLTNNKLETLARSYPNGTAPIAELLPLETVQSFADSHKRNTQQREPFHFREGIHNSYCINIFNQNEYVGILSIHAENPAISHGEKQIFEYFAQFVIRAVRKTIRRNKSQMVTVRSLFSDLLNCFPVSRAKLQQVICDVHPEKTLWICAALNPVDSMRNIPDEYFCTQIEAYFKRGYAVPFSPYIAFLIPLSKDNVTMSSRSPEMEAVIEDIDLRAGLSAPFEDLMQVRGFYRQAVLALQHAEERKPEQRVTYFDEIALPYVLKNSIGELRPEHLIPRELLLLRDSDNYGAEYWETLKTYLNNEMNASQTARDLYIHRTTFLKRLARIEEILDISTPEKRMYLRYCIYMAELFNHQT